MMRTAFVVLVVALAGCGMEEEAEAVGASHALSLTASAEAPTAAVTSSLRVTAMLQSSSGAPAAGRVVNFVVVSGGGTVFAGAAQTDTTGTAREVWTLGTSAGVQVLEVRAVDPVTGDPITHARVVATATPGPAVSYTYMPRLVEVRDGEAWDSSEVRLYGRDTHSNRLDLPPSHKLRSIRYEGGGYLREPPTCTVSGSLVTCPKAPGMTCQPNTECTTLYRAVFETDVPGLTPEVQVAVRWR